MPKCKIVIMHTARSQLRDIATIHRMKVGAKSAKRITDKLLKSIRRLEDFPNMGAIPPGAMFEKFDYRMLIIEDYLCFYKQEKDAIYISQILHGSVDYVKFLIK